MKKPLSSIQTQWDLSPLLKDDSEVSFEAEKKRAEEESYKFINKWKDRDDYLLKPEVLLEAMEEYEQWVKTSGIDGRLGHYYSLRKALDEANPQLKAKIQKVTDLDNKIRNDIQFFTLKLGKVTPELQKEFLSYPKLAKYRHYLEMLFQTAKYQLPDSEEKIINLKNSSAHSSWIAMTSGFLAKEEQIILQEDGKRKKVPFSQFFKLINSTNKQVRDDAARALNESIAKHVEVAEAEMNAIINDWKVDNALRQMGRPDLGRHLSDDIDSEVVDALLDAVSKRNSIAHRFYHLKAELFGVKKLEYHERGVPFIQVEKAYPYEDALSLVKRVFERLDPQFSEILMRFHAEGLVDVFPKKGKRSGAFCSSDLITSPAYVLLNHAEKFDDVITLAHEFGHAINDELMRSKQNALNFSTPLSTAEVASTFMQDFVTEEILKTADDEERLCLLLEGVDEAVGSAFRQVACYQFEQELHKNIGEKGYLSKDEIGKLFQKYMSGYMGDAVEMSPGSENWWVYWSHIRHFFYVYSYASGFLISKFLQGMVRMDKTSISKVKDFLSAGSSDSPKNIFKKMDIDITDANFWNRGLDQIESLLDETEALAKKLGKIPAK